MLGGRSRVQEGSDLCGMVWYGMVWFGPVWYWRYGIELGPKPNRMMGQRGKDGRKNPSLILAVAGERECR